MKEKERKCEREGERMKRGDRVQMSDFLHLLHHLFTVHGVQGESFSGKMEKASHDLFQKEALFSVRLYQRLPAL